MGPTVKKKRKRWYDVGFRKTMLGSEDQRSVHG